MDNKIMLNSSKAIFEPHIRPERELPFMFHMNITQSSHVCNFHENIELLYFMQGNGHVEYDSKSYPVRAGDLIVVNTYAVHQVVSEETLTYFCLIIDSSFCKYNNIDVSTLHFTELIRDDRFTPLFRQVIDERNDQKPFKNTAIKLAVLEILLLLCRNYSSPQVANAPIKDSSQKHIRSAILYIKQNFSRKLTVEEVASATGLSKYHFMREFKRCTGCTLTDYVNFIRCERAKELLQTGQYKVKNVAFLCGFESESYFTSVFKKYTAALPSEFVG